MSNINISISYPQQRASSPSGKPPAAQRLASGFSVIYVHPSKDGMEISAFTFNSMSLRPAIEENRAETARQLELAMSVLMHGIFLYAMLACMASRHQQSGGIQVPQPRAPRGRAPGSQCPGGQA